MKHRLAALGAAGVLLGATALAWAVLDLPGRSVVRGHLGDVGVVMVIVAVLGVVLSRLGTRAWIGLAAGLALLVELGQALGLRGEGLAGELTIGATFDPLDLVAYALGLAISWCALIPGSTRSRARGA